MIWDELWDVNEMILMLIKKSNHRRTHVELAEVVRNLLLGFGTKQNCKIIDCQSSFPIQCAMPKNRLTNHQNMPAKAFSLPSGG